MASDETNYDDRLVIGGTSAEPNPYTLQAGKTYTAAPYEGSGGAVYVESDGTVTGNNVTFTDNSVTDSKGRGGAICNGSGAVLNLTGATFTGNNTTGLKGQGGAVYNGGKATITGSTVSGNKATMGGAVFNNGGTLEISGGTISSNNAKYGGAIQNFGGGTMIITGAVFSGNSAADNGGAIAHNAGSATITNTTFTGNTAKKEGGAICNTSILTLADVTFSGNTAKNEGGAIYNEGTVNMTGTVTLATENDELCNTGTLNWNLSGGTASYGSVAGYQYLTNTGTLTITVGNEQEAGSYTIAAGDLSNLDGKETFTLTGAEGQSSITVNGESVVYNDKRYTLATNNNGTEEDPTDDNLVLTVDVPKPSVADAAVTVNGKYVYNGNAQKAAVTVVLDSRTLVQDTDYTLTYDNNVNAGLAAVTVTGIGDYTGTKNTAFTIARKELTVIGSAVNGKTYDGTTDAAVGTIGVLSGVVAGDDVSICTATGSFDNKDAGNGRNVTIQYTLSGTDASNYTVAGSVTSADIEKRSVTLTSADDTKPYDGTPLTNDTVTVSGDGWADGEGASYTVTGSQTDVGSSPNTFSCTMKDGTKADNYNVTTRQGTLTVTAASTVCSVNNYNNTARSDMIQFVNGLVYVTYDNGEGVYQQTDAINDVTGWNVVETRRDLTGDRLCDVQITSDDGYGSTWVATLRNDYLKDGTITLNYQFIGAYNNELWAYLGSADVNADGKAEVLMVQTFAGADEYGHRNVAAWVTDSTGTWVGNEWVGALTSEWNVAGTADVTGDGQDNVVLRRADGMIGYWDKAGSNNIIEIADSTGKTMLTSADFSGDGADDFLFTNADGDFFTWSNIGEELSVEKIGNLSELGGHWGFAGAGDYNGDGKEELLWCDSSACKIAYSEANQENFKNLIQIV